MVGKRKMDIFSWCVISTLPCRRETRKKNTSRNQISTKLWLVSKYPAQTAVKYHLSWLNQSPSCTSVLSSFSLFFRFVFVYLVVNECLTGRFYSFQCTSNGVLYICQVYLLAAFTAPYFMHWLFFQAQNQRMPLKKW